MIAFFFLDETPYKPKEPFNNSKLLFFLCYSLEADCNIQDGVLCDNS